MILDIFINYDGNCREAMEFYSKIFNEPIKDLMTYADAPSDGMEVPEGAENLICYASIKIGDKNVMFSDSYPGMPLIVGNNVSMTMVTSNKKELEDLFNALKEGGKVDMPLEKTFWSELYGCLTDKFGIVWQFSHENKDALQQEGAFEIVNKKVDDMPAMYIPLSLPMDQMDEIGKAFDEIGKYCVENKGEATGAFVLYNGFSEGLMHMYCCISVKELLPEGGRVRAQTIPGVETLMARAVHKGSYEKLTKFYEVFMAWVKNEGYEYEEIPSREIYLNDPACVKEDELLTEILIPVKKI